jgi:hypothetical protein
MNNYNLTYYNIDEYYFSTTNIGYDADDYIEYFYNYIEYDDSENYY